MNFNPKIIYTYIYTVLKKKKWNTKNLFHEIEKVKSQDNHHYRKTCFPLAKNIKKLEKAGWQQPKQPLEMEKSLE